MKKFLVLFSAMGAFAFTPLSTAEAADSCTRIVGYNHCGQPIYAYFHVHGYDSCGRPIGHWVTQYPSTPAPSPAPICIPVPHHHHHHNHGSRIVIQGPGWGFQVVK